MLMALHRKYLFTKHTNGITPKLYTTELEQNESNVFNVLFDKYLKLKSNNEKISSSQYDFDELNKNHELNYIVDLAYDLMGLLNIPVKKSDGMIELWSYCPNGKKLSSSLAIHEDDYGGLPYKVETCIFYLRKDEGINNGNLIYLENTKIREFMCLTFKNNVERKLEVKKNMVVVMNGNLEHQPEEMSGWGLRNCIVVQFKSYSR